MQISVKTVGFDKVIRQIAALQKQQASAMRAAQKVEAYRLGRLMREELRAGRAGDTRLKPLSIIASLSKTRRFEKTPLRNLAAFIRYHYDYSQQQASVGWTGPRVEPQWRDIARRQQEGFRQEVTPAQRRYFYLAGEQAAEQMRATQFRSRKKLYRKNTAKIKPFYLRKTTRYLETPPRPFIEPFWRKYRDEATANIIRNFARKLRGERI